MEIACVNQGSVRVKGKNSTFFVNPSGGKQDADVFLFTGKVKDFIDVRDVLVFDGPGDYEVAGTSIKAEKMGDSTAFDFFDENQSALVMTAAALPHVKETDGYTAAIIIADEKIGDLSTLTSEIVAVAGPEEFLPQDRSNIKKTDKLNLKKIEEYKGFIVHLAK